jgi:hypothetical protein
MIFRSIKIFAVAASVSALIAGSAMAQTTPAAGEAVQRAGFAFTFTETVRATIESVDTDNRLITFSMADGNMLSLPIGGGVKDIGKIKEDAPAVVSFDEVVTILNLKRKGVGSQAARRDGATNESARFTYTVVGVDQAAKKISIIGPSGGAVRTFTPSGKAAADAMATMKQGDVLVGIATPLSVTAVTQ